MIDYRHRVVDAGVCDVVIGVPAHYELVRTTRSYYRSTYVFVSRRGLAPLRGMGLMMIAQLVDEAGFTESADGGNHFRLVLYFRKL